MPPIKKEITLGTLIALAGMLFTMVSTVGGNVLLFGYTYGKFSERMAITDQLHAEEKAENNRRYEEQKKLVTDIQAVRDRTHDLERDARVTWQSLLVLDNYTRGRISNMPYKGPPPSMLIPKSDS